MSDLAKHLDAYEKMRNSIIEECAEAAYNAYASFTRDDYIMLGPSGIAQRIVNSIKSLKQSSHD